MMQRLGRFADPESPATLSPTAFLPLCRLSAAVLFLTPWRGLQADDEI